MKYRLETLDTIEYYLENGYSNESPLYWRYEGWRRNGLGRHPADPSLAIQMANRFAQASRLEFPAACAKHTRQLNKWTMPGHRATNSVVTIDFYWRD